MKTLLERQNLSEAFAALKPTTFEGRAFVDKFNGFNEASYVQVYEMLSEGARCRDAQISSFAKSAQAKISANMGYSFQVGYALEEAIKSNSLFAKPMNEEYGHLRYWEEADVVAAIKNGIFENASVLPRLKYLHENICLMPQKKVLNEGGFVAFNPISYVYESNGCHYFMVEGKTFKHDLEKISEDEAPNAEFAQVNQAISEVPFDTDKELFSLTMLPGAVNVTKKGKVTINGEEVTGKEFVGAMSNAISECMDPQKRAYNERMADNICLIMEHFSNLCILDAVHTVKSKTTNESYSLMAHKNGYFIFENTKTSKTFKKFVSINESVSVIKKFTGINLHSIYAKECMNEMKDIQKIRKLREEQVKIVKDIDDLSLSIQNEQATLVPGTPAFEESVENLDTLKTEKEIAESNIEMYDAILDTVKDGEEQENQ